LYDRGIKTPFIIKWPKGIQKKGITDALISSIDIAPTILEVAGIPASESIQGISFTRLFKNADTKFRNFIFAEHNWHDYSAYERCVRTKDFLYIFNKRPEWDNGGPIDANQSPSAFSLKSALKKGELDSLQLDAYITPRPAEEFYDNRKDPLQQHNLIHEKNYSGTIDSLRKILYTWREQTGDTYPSVLTPDWYHRETGDSLPAIGTRGEMPGAARRADTINAKGIF
jgi:arylsulfatase A-like enzyme